MKKNFDHSLLLAAPLFVSSFLFVGCFEDEEGKIKILKEELNGLAFDQQQLESKLATGKEDLANYEKMRIELERAGVLNQEIEVVTKELEAITTQSDELKASTDFALSEFEDYQADYRRKVREEIVGKAVDLSETMGGGFEAVKVLSVSPLGIRIYASSGPQPVPLENLPVELKERLQLDEEGLRKFREKEAHNIELRVEKYQEWKKSIVGREGKSGQDEIGQRLDDLQKEIEALEKAANDRTSKINEYESRGSKWAMNSSKASNTAKKELAVKYMECYRRKAQNFTAENSNTKLLIERLRSEMEDLKKLKKLGS